MWWVFLLTRIFHQALLRQRQRLNLQDVPADVSRHAAGYARVGLRAVHPVSSPPDAPSRRSW